MIIYRVSEYAQCAGSGARVRSNARLARSPCTGLTGSARFCHRVAVITLERQRRILRTVLADGSVTVRLLAQRFEVSESTIRRDLQVLDRDGELVRTHGGAVTARRPGAGPAAVSGAGPRTVGELAGPGDGEPSADVDGPDVHIREPEPPYAVHSGADLDQRLRVARAAAGLVRDGEVVLLDIGTTTALVARELRGREVTVITSNLAVLDELRDDGAVRVVLLGGVLRRNFQTLVGSLTVSALAQVSADVAFLSCTGVRANGRVVDNMAVEVPVKQALVDAADRVVLLATDRKFPGTGSFRVCSLSDVDVLVTNAGVHPATLAICRDAGRKVVLT